ncbi:MAG: Jag N-terminal domain-containing protein [Oscillospiraceae bacterium]|nr:Jag N-terminal domain-containing protein [Oscillospiraceae bacterium]MBQ5322681.1 Jag N-terminal domain-containing protein [Oscillospiraceae bacterium]MBQ8594781.1 Jag N-terminal domain-containing protein [Oscillospiraceae bacterium]
MEREFLATGKTVEEAIEAAYEKAGVDREYVTVEIIERPKKKFFGLKTVPATAKAIIDEDYWNKMFGVKEKKAEAPKKKKETKEQKPKAEKPVQEQPKKQEPKQEKPKKEQKPQQPKKQEPKKEVKSAEAKIEEAPKEEVKVLAPEVLERKGSDAANYIKEVLTALGYPEAEVTYTQKDGMIVLQLSGDEMGAVVGRRGDNLDAMQYLASLVANKSEGSYVRVVLDIDDYRSKREASLRAYARKTAANAVKSGRSITLEPMNPYERRIVHSTVQTVSGATSKSIGSEPNRRVVISPIEGAKPRGDRKFRDNKGDRRNGKGNRAPRESQKVIVAPNEQPKNDVSSLSLYGRIDLD